MCDKSKDAPECIVEQLLQTPFPTRVFPEKLIIVARGRPTPALTNLIQDSKVTATSGAYTRHFQTTTYEKYQWLTGCPKLNRLFCWPCILFSVEQVVWNTKGYADLGNLCGSMLRHERSQNHIRSVIALKTFEGARADSHLNQKVKLCIEKHNKKVKNNRDVLQRIVNIVTVLACQEHCEEESPDSQRGNYIELVDLVKEYDVILATHLETSVFSNLSSHVHNDLIDAVSMVMLDKIKSEISQAPFITIMFDKTTCSSSAAQLSAVLRYVSKEGLLNERFIGFANLIEDCSVTTLCEHLSTFVEQFDCGAKLVAQTYDGAAVMPGELNNLQAKVKEKYPCSTFVHCRTHDLNLVLSQACAKNKHCNIFFSTLNGLASFFSSSIKRTRALDVIVQRRFPKAPPPRWNHTSGLVQTAQEHYSSLMELFNNIINEPHKWDSPSVLAAGGFLSNLEDDKFRFLLQVFADIFAHTDVFFSALQSKSMDIVYCVTEVKRVTEHLECKKAEYHEGYAAFATVTNSEESPAKRARHSLNNEEDFQKLYTEIFDTVLSQLETRFGSLGKLKFLELLNVAKYSKYTKSFPETALAFLKETYGQFFDLVLLRSELVVLYSSSNMAKKNVSELMTYIIDNGIQEAMREVYKLCSLFLTIPSSTVTGDRTSALKRIKMFTRTTVAQEHSSALGLLAIERDLLKQLKSESTFYDNVIEHYVKKNHCNDLVYK
ncbi:hypothetical protein NQD34_015749 [Periophthalmus magnuspinnatus]|nr:hypothetical protein NQD34_015749 [Periophthalmus magnuspinnatus]